MDSPLWMRRMASAKIMLTSTVLILGHCSFCTSWGTVFVTTTWGPNNHKNCVYMRQSPSKLTWTTAVSVCIYGCHNSYAVTDGELGHMMQRQPPEAQYPSNSFKYGCCCKKAGKSNTWILHMFNPAAQKNLYKCFVIISIQIVALSVNICSLFTVTLTFDPPNLISSSSGPSGYFCHV